MNGILQLIIVGGALLASLAFIGYRIARRFSAKRAAACASCGEGSASRWKGPAVKAEKPIPPHSAIAGLQDFEDKEDGDGCSSSGCGGCRGCG